jgi:hypothetical protein
MQLDYLLFDISDEETGSCSFDAMASAVPARREALIDEIEAVLGWAHREFGPAGEDGEWDFELQAVDDHDLPLEITYDVESARVLMPPGSGGRVTLALTLGGTSAFGAAFREAFPGSG